MKRMIRFAAFLAVAFAGGCNVLSISEYRQIDTPSSDAFPGYGYVEREIERGVYHLSFYGRSNDIPERIGAFRHRRAEELCGTDEYAGKPTHDEVVEPNFWVNLRHPRATGIVRCAGEQ